jgi:hypothetical protein
MTETPSTVHGRLLEAAHISGYTAKRAVAELEWLLDGDRWREVGSGYESINDFLESIDLSEFKIAIERRKPLAKRLAALQASQRTTAKALGVNHATISRDVADAPLKQIEAPKQANRDSASVADATPAPFQIPAAEVADTAVKEAKRRASRSEREQGRRSERAQREQEAREAIAAAAKLPYELLHESVSEWRPNGVNSIITDPPYVGDSIPLYEHLRDFAVDVLPDGGPLVVMTWQAILPDVIRALQHKDLAYRWTICWRYANTENTADHARRVFDCWKPILVYHKGSMPKDAPMMRDEIASTAPDKDHHEWGQSLDGFSRLIRSFSQPGDLVCDPFLGGGTTAVAALAKSRRFTGCDTDKAAIATTEGRLAA